jgi:hypothetical protein
MNTQPSNGQKNIKEYFLEFIMLFLAISLGFFAENYREQMNEKENEREYMESFLHDLTVDTSNLHKSLPFLNDRVASMDSVFRFFKANPDADKVPVTVLKHIKRASWAILARRNTTTISQLKNAGGLRLIKNRKVADSIAKYDIRWMRIESSYERYMTNQHAIYTLEEQMLNAFDGLDAYISNDGYNNQDNIPKSGFVKIDRKYLSQYLNILAREQTTTRQDARSVNITINVTDNLIDLIRKEYKIEN